MHLSHRTRIALVCAAFIVFADAQAPVFAWDGDIVSTARQYIGRNPTGRSRLWCAAFMDLVLRQTGHKPGSNLARDYASYGRRVSGPVVGALAVMRREPRQRGAHVLRAVGLA